MLYYKRYHLTKDVIDSPRCGGWLNYLPVCLCCAKDTPMKAMENEVISNSTFNLLKLITFKEAMFRVRFGTRFSWMGRDFH